MTRVRIGFDVVGLTTYSLATILDALQRACEVALGAEAESRGLLDRPVPWAARAAAKALHVSPDLSIERIRMMSRLVIWVAVPGGGTGFITLLRMIRDLCAMRQPKRTENELLRAQLTTFRRTHGLRTDGQAGDAPGGHLLPASRPPLLEIVEDDDS